ncbi:hypothetical protein [Paludisphaera soli]|uniref:hypothetical protein n=1 Tax=Paludisphaera soli TaxID=2712865 RepID=UPI0013EE35CA|nr:hypothetical protein [Paludisphaera soli]
MVELDLACTAACEAVRESGGVMTKINETENPQAVPTVELDEIRDLLRRAAGKDAGAMPELRAALDRRPEVWRRLGDPAAHVERTWIGELAGPDAALAEVFARRAADLRRELIGPAPSPLERLLVDRVVACWLQVRHADLAAARPGGRTAEGRDRMTRRQSAAATPAPSRRWRGCDGCRRSSRRRARGRTRRRPSPPACTTIRPISSLPPPAEGRGPSGGASSTEGGRRRRRVRGS